jgi:FKBP-type peptidyl-prolyl cis-trans isomerase FkpA
MNRTSLITITIVAALGTGCSKSKRPTSETISEDDRNTFYALGFMTARNLKNFQLTDDELEIVQRGVADAVHGKAAAVDLQIWAPKVVELSTKRTGDKVNVEKEKGKTYAANAAKESGAEALPSGLVFKTIQAGTGASPSATDVVKVKYRGTLVDGTEFDKSDDASIPLSGVIACWTEGIQKMKVGGHAKLVCPSTIAYGDTGRPPTIPGGATLVFDVELLDTGSK